MCVCVCVYISFPTVFTWSLSAVKAAYQIVNMFQVNNKRSQNDLVKTFLAPHDEVLASFEHKFIAPRGKSSALDT